MNKLDTSHQDHEQQQQQQQDEDEHTEEEGDVQDKDPDQVLYHTINNDDPDPGYVL